MKRIVLAITILLVIGAASGVHASQISLRPTHVGGQISNPTFYPIALYDVGNIAAIQSPAGWVSLESVSLTSAAIRDINAAAMGDYFSSGIGPENVNGFPFSSEGGSLSAPFPVPEHVTLLLLGIALIAAGSLGRIKQWSSWKKRERIAAPATSKSSIRTTVFRIEWIHHRQRVRGQSFPHRRNDAMLL